MNFDLLNAQDLTLKVKRPTVLSVIGGSIGLFAWRAHPILGLLTGIVVSHGIYDFYNQKATSQEVARDLGKHASAVGGALLFGAHPVLGYLAGAIAGQLVLGDKDRQQFEKLKQFLASKKTETALTQG